MLYLKKLRENSYLVRMLKYYILIRDVISFPDSLKKSTE